MNDKAQKNKTQKQIRTKNVLESINGIGSSVVNTVKDEGKQISDEFFRQLLGQQKNNLSKQHGEIQPGASVRMNEQARGEADKKLQEQIYFERRLSNEESGETNKKLHELRLRLQAIQTEALNLINSTAQLSEEVKTAVLQNVNNASEYQVNFFESIISMIVSFRKKIDNAVDWMQGHSKRAEKKNYWSQYKKKGASFLLSPDHYSQRSAG